MNGSVSFPFTDSCAIGITLYFFGYLCVSVIRNKGYLPSTAQIVYIDGVFSGSLDIAAGVSQGILLGALVYFVICLL